jgi:hypothetical protein
VLQEFKLENLTVGERDVGCSPVIREFEYVFLTVENPYRNGRRERISTSEAMIYQWTSLGLGLMVKKDNVPRPYRTDAHTPGCEQTAGKPGTRNGSRRSVANHGMIMNEVRCILQVFRQGIDVQRLTEDVGKLRAAGMVQGTVHLGQVSQRDRVRRPNRLGQIFRQGWRVVIRLLVWDKIIGGGGASVGGVDGSRGGDSGGGRGRDLHVNECVGDVVDAVVRDGGRVRLERVHFASRGREGDVWRVVTLPS